MCRGKNRRRDTKNNKQSKKAPEKIEKMRNMKKIFILLTLFSLLYPALLTWPSDCIQSPDNPNPSHQIICYHQVALTYAINNDKAHAIQYCSMIGDPTWEFSKEGQMAKCFRDVALMVDPPDITICGFIIDNDLEKELCIKEVEAELGKANNSCNLMFILPLFIAGSFFFRNSVHKF